jgi:hypothetical protein
MAAMVEYGFTVQTLTLVGIAYLLGAFYALVQSFATAMWRRLTGQEPYWWRVPIITFGWPVAIWFGW